MIDYIVSVSGPSPCIKVIIKNSFYFTDAVQKSWLLDGNGFIES